MIEPETLEVANFDLKTKLGFIIVTYIDGSTKTWALSDPDFLKRKFILRPQEDDS